MAKEFKLSRVQKKIMEFIRDEIVNNNYSPSIREIAEAVGLKSTSSVHAHLVTLEKQGYIKKDSARSRTIVITNEDYMVPVKNVVNIPIIGSVAAGQPIYAEQNIEGYFPMAADDMPSGNIFMLRVKGDSMINVGIFDGDLITVRSQDTVNNGEIAVVLVDDSATVKTYYKEADHIRLQPENDSMDPIIVNDCVVLGKIAGLYRNYV